MQEPRWLLRSHAMYSMYMQEPRFGCTPLHRTSNIEHRTSNFDRHLDRHRDRQREISWGFRSTNYKNRSCPKPQVLERRPNSPKIIYRGRKPQYISTDKAISHTICHPVQMNPVTIIELRIPLMNLQLFLMSNI